MFHEQTNHSYRIASLRVSLNLIKDRSYFPKSTFEHEHTCTLVKSKSIQEINKAKHTGKNIQCCSPTNRGTKWVPDLSTCIARGNREKFKNSQVQRVFSPNTQNAHKQWLSIFMCYQDSMPSRNTSFQASSLCVFFNVSPCYALVICLWFSTSIFFSYH